MKILVVRLSSALSLTTDVDMEGGEETRQQLVGLLEERTPSGVWEQ